MKKENSSQNLCDYVALHTLDALQCCMDTLQCHGGLSAAGTSGRLLSVFYPLNCHTSQWRYIMFIMTGDDKIYGIGYCLRVRLVGRTPSSG